MIDSQRSVFASLAVTPIAAPACDLPSCGGPAVYVAPPDAVFSWIGFYIKANGDHGFGSGAFTGHNGLAVAAARVGTFAEGLPGGRPS